MIFIVFQKGICEFTFGLSKRGIVLLDQITDGGGRIGHGPSQASVSCVVGLICNSVNISSESATFLEIY